MAVAFDVASESHTGTTGSTSEASFSWSHAAAGSGVKGVVVFTSVTNETGDLATAVTYGGVSMTAVTGGRAVDTAGELADCKAWFLGTSVPQGTQTVVVTRTNNANIMYAQAYTFTAATDTEPFGVVLLQGDQAVVEQNVTDGSPGTNSVRVAMIWSGFDAASQMSAGANTTTGPNIDLGARTIRGGRETTAGQGSRPVGFDSATISDDVAAVHLAVREVTASTQNLTGSLFTKAPTFFTGAITAAYNLTGTLFIKAPTFFTGTVTSGAVTLTGTLFTKAPTFPQGAITTGGITLTGILFQNTPTFPTGTVTTTVTLTGTLYVNTPTFPTGTIGQAGTIFGNLFVKAPTFFTGSFVQGGPSFWTPNPAAYVGVTRYGPSPWGAELSGQRFEKAPTFPAGTVS